MKLALKPSFISKYFLFPFSHSRHNFSTNQIPEKKTQLPNVLISRASIQEQIRSIVKNFEQFYENREKPEGAEQEKIAEEHMQQLLNKMILRREFCNDAIGVSLKSLSLFTATSS